MNRIAMLLLLILAAGCGPSKPTTVFGKVTFKKMPLVGGVVVFVPDMEHGSSGPLVKAVVQADGTYSLNTEELPSVPSGWYCMTVSAVEMHNYWVNGERVDRPYSILPAKYGDPGLSGLKCEIKSGKKNEVLLNLE